jgi:superfamily II DNA or RNA helicase
LPYQLEPALALVRGRGSRLLLADDVGLGKTVQAGLAIAELRARGMAERILILTPAGLRHQWAHELESRFGISAIIVDFHDVRLRVASLPVGLNPWSTVPIAIASIDYAKRPEVLRSVSSCHWDVLVVDEAHGAARDGDRHHAVAALASRAAYVVLLTATPHNGEVRAFNALCRFGAYADALLIFKRTRADVSLGIRRRVHRLHVRPSRAEGIMHERLSAFTRSVQSEQASSAAWLALSVLHKRALSSARALEQSIERRLNGLGADQIDSRQLFLPLPDPGGEFDASDQAPDWLAGQALNDAALEGHLLRAVATAAKHAAIAETKCGAILRLLRRVREPVVIFTEYRDTLLHLRHQLDQSASLLHGGLTREERATAIDDFVSGRRRILLATDAGGEGLNLHHRCRIVINLELPWNPMRLEQRIGRVDRIGQSRTVHVFHLIARGTGESRILERLKARIARARQDITAADPVEDDEQEVAEIVMGHPARVLTAEQEVQMQPDAGSPERVMVRLESEAVAEVGRLSWARRLSEHPDSAIQASLEAGGPWLTSARLRETRCRLGRQIVVIFAVESEDGHGRLVDSTLAPLLITLSKGERPIDHELVRLVLGSTASELRARASRAAAEERSKAVQLVMAMVETRVARERAVAAAITPISSSLWQAGLFDRRAEHAQAISHALHAEAKAGTVDRIDVYTRAGILAVRPARLLLAIAP